MPDDVTVLREILRRELETINAYEEMAARLSDPRLRQIVEHITDEEREHVAEMYELIVAYDPRQKARTAPSEEHLAGLFGTSPSGDLRFRPEDQPSAAAVAGTAPLVPDRSSSGSGPGGEVLPGQLPAADMVEVGAEDPEPPPAPVFPSGAWSVGPLKPTKT